MGKFRRQGEPLGVTAGHCVPVDSPGVDCKPRRPRSARPLERRRISAMGESMRKRNQRLGRNDPCPCGSGKKSKHCHGVVRSAPPPAASAHAQAVREHFLPHAAVVWIASDVFESALTWDQAKAALAEMNWESATLSMAMLNTVSAELALGERLSTPRGAQKVIALTKYLFAPEYQTAAFKIYLENRHQTFIPLAGQACIAMTEACLRFCNRNGGARFNQPHEHPAFARVLLSFHEQLMRGDLTKNLNPEELSPDQFRYFVRNYLSANFDTDFLEMLRRHYLLFVEPVPGGVLEQRVGKTARAWFTEVTGMDPRRYGALSVFCMHHGYPFDIESPDLRHLAYNVDEMLQNAAPDVAAMYRRLHDLAAVAHQLPSADVTNWEMAIYGLHYLRAKPLLHLHDSQYVCLHKHLLAEKILGGTVHVLTELVDVHPPAGWSPDAKNRRLQVRREFGYLFEDLLRKVLLALFDGPTTKLLFSFNRTDGGESDALVVVGKTALAFEFVHHPWSLVERTSGDAGVFIEHLEDNITKAGKLCAQIAKEGRVKELDAPIECALPIVVTSEMVPLNVMTAPTLEKLLIAATGQQFVRGHGIVRPMQVLSVIQLENLDRIEGIDSPERIAAFLTLRSADLLTRLSGHTRMDQKLVESRKLKKFEDAADAMFHDMGPSLFKSEGAAPG